VSRDRGVALSASWARTGQAAAVDGRRRREEAADGAEQRKAEQSRAEQSRGEHLLGDVGSLESRGAEQECAAVVVGVGVRWC
jgi:hypothetical protein